MIYNIYTDDTYGIYGGVVIMEDKRVKFTTTLLKSVIDKLYKLAPYYEGRNANDVIESLVLKEWEERKNEVEIKQSDRRIYNGNSQ
jgi:hypothetical protein